MVSLTWERAQAHPDNAPLGGCPNNGGRKIFPGKLEPNDEHPEYEREVDLVATVVPAVPGETVYFEVWDVDDPFDQTHPEMPDVGIMNGDSSGPDNRGGLDPGVGTYRATTGAEGEARVTITEISMQPGNNYRTEVSLLQDALNRPPHRGGPWTRWATARVLHSVSPVPGSR